jgi:hypothetical protein
MRIYFYGLFHFKVVKTYLLSRVKLLKDSTFTTFGKKIIFCDYIGAVENNLVESTGQFLEIEKIVGLFN